MQLTQDEKEKIRAEEIYRVEVQRELKAPESQSRWAKLIRFLNTSLGLWVLSSLLLGGVAAAYSQLRTYAAERQERRMIAGKLSSQIGMRLIFCGDIIKRAGPLDERADQQPSDDTKNAYVAAVHTFLDDTPETRLSPDFKDRSTVSLEYELSTLDSSKVSDSLLEHMEDLMKLRQDLNSYDKLNPQERRVLLATVKSTLVAIEASL